MVTKPSSEIIIVGGGVIGCAAARELAPDHDVLLIEADQIAGHATGRSAGLVAPSLFYGDEPALARYTNEAFRAFDGTEQFEFIGCNRIELIPEDEVAEAQETAETRCEQGFPVRFLQPGEIEDTYPDVDATQFGGAIEYGDTGWVDPYSYTVALASDAENQGAEIRTGVRVEDVMIQDGRVAGVTTEEGDVVASTVLVAAGWQTRELVAEYLKIPLRPYRTQCLVLDLGKDLSERLPLGRVADEKLYFRPEHNGDLLLGGGSAPIDRPEHASLSVDEGFRNDVAQKVPKIFQGFEQAGLVDGWAGLDAATPDGKPIVDAPEEAPKGLVIATGFTGLGVMTAPMAAQIARETIVGKSTQLPEKVFMIDRFDTRSSEFTFTSTFDH